MTWKIHFFVKNGHKVKEIILVKYKKSMFNLWCKDIYEKYVTSCENVIQKKPRPPGEHFNSHV